MNIKYIEIRNNRYKKRKNFIKYDKDFFFY